MDKKIILPASIDACLVQFLKVILTQWSRACRKSNNSSVQSSSVKDREPTLVSHSSRRSRVWTQCSASSHFCRTVSRGSFNAIHSSHRMYLDGCHSARDILCRLSSVRDSHISNKQDRPKINITSRNSSLQKDRKHVPQKHTMSYSENAPTKEK